MDDLTKRRLAHNEQLFREVNEERDRAQDDARELQLVCECASQECTETIALASKEYEAVRRVPNRYIIVPGHQVAEIERVVEDRGAFAVVEKRLAA